MHHVEKFRFGYWASPADLVCGMQTRKKCNAERTVSFRKKITLVKQFKENVPVLFLNWNPNTGFTSQWSTKWRFLGQPDEKLLPWWKILSGMEVEQTIQFFFLLSVKTIPTGLCFLCEVRFDSFSFFRCLIFNYKDVDALFDAYKKRGWQVYIALYP